MPPSETKRPGGSGAPMDLGRLALPALTPQREEAVARLTALAADPGEMARVLRLTPRQAEDAEPNARVRTSPTMPAMDRFTGVLYDALDARGLPERARAWLADHVLIQTALLGPVGAADPLPAFRLSAGHRLPGLPPAKHHWAHAASGALRDLPGPVVDLRSEAYRDLAPVPAGAEQTFVRVVEEGPGGAVRALNHFNKKTKGLFVRALAEKAARVGTLAELVAWGAEHGFALRPGAPGETLLVAGGAEASPIRGGAGASPLAPAGP
nr:peroxide stress protein YaaA [Microbacterium sp. ZXX196]